MERFHCHWPLLDKIDLCSWAVTTDSKRDQRGNALATTDLGGDDMLALNANQGDPQDDLGPNIEDPVTSEGIRVSEETVKSKCATALAHADEELTSCGRRV